MVDEEDKDLEKYCWRLGSGGYVRRGPQRLVNDPVIYRWSVHRIVLGRKLGRDLQPHEFVDHINGIRTDNRRSNLRLATKMTNAFNRIPQAGHRYKGAIFDKRREEWYGSLNVEGKRFWTIKADSEEEAAWMRDQWALVLHGDYARLNFEYSPVQAQ
jgi:HNH endonuclease